MVFCEVKINLYLKHLLCSTLDIILPEKLSLVGYSKKCSEWCIENRNSSFEKRMTHGRYNSCLKIFKRKSDDGDFMTFREKKRTIDKYKEESPNGPKRSQLL